LRSDARSMSALRPRLSRGQSGATAAPRRRGARIVLAGGHWRRGDACGGDRDGPGLTPRTKFLTIGEAHEVAVPRSLEVQAPEPDFESMLTVYFGAPSMFITLWFGFDYGANPPLGTLII
jgi:hypothetical protein